ncbi:MAG: GNAT family N-acetyltransferase [Bacteroides sp.]|nr:GNAT family N-acetyltransferase [Bacteroides sp.]
MIHLKEIKTNHEHYPFVEALLQTAFPLQERRDADKQREVTDTHPLFHCDLITDGNTPVGLLTYWKFETFVYIEHFAIDPRLRNGGYGSQALQLFLQQHTLPIVLEAEEPTDEITRRRIGFYQRQGFTLQEIPYLQPPYRPSEDWFPLKLMTFGSIELEKEFITVRNNIYREVYCHSCNRLTNY